MASADIDAAEVKLVLLGDTGVGKSSVAAQFVRGAFDSLQAATIGAAYLSRPFQLDGRQPIKFQIWDTAGQEKYESLAPMYYRKAGAAIVMYDLTSAHSFDRLRDWVRELADNGPPDIVVACVGNKADLVADDASRDVSRADAETFARDEHALYFETSARTGFGVTEVFTALAREVISRRATAAGTEEDPDADKVGDLGRDTRKAAPKGGCCA